MQGLVGLGRTSASTQREMGALESVGRAGHNLTQVFTGALWWLPWGGQTGRPGPRHPLWARWEVTGLDQDGGREQWPNSS